MTSTNVEKLCLTWTSYQTALMTTLKSLMTSDDSKDVTLVCEDGTQFRAHKFLLSSSSPFFEKMFSNSRGRYDKFPHNSIVYLTNIEAESLDSILKFIYLGQVFLQQSELKAFMTAAKLLRIVGLSELYSAPSPPSSGPLPSPPVTPAPSNNISCSSDQDSGVKAAIESNASQAQGFSFPSVQPLQTSINEKITTYEPIELLQEQSKNRNDPLQDFIDGLLMIKQEPSGDNKAESITSLTPPPGDELPILQFDTPTKSPSTSLVSTLDCLDSHGGIEKDCSVTESQLSRSSLPKIYYCQHCDYKSAKQYNVKKHTLSIHEKVRYPCTVCKYQATETGHLKKHMRTMHSDKPHQ